MRRRKFLVTAGALSAAGLARNMGLSMPANAQTNPPATGRTALYASAGKQLVHFDLDAAGAALVPRAAVTLPENVQYAWPHPSRRMLYVASSNGPDNDRHFVTAFAIDPASGALARHGNDVPVPHRTINATVDRDGAFLLLASNKPRTVYVFRIAADGSIGTAIEQQAQPDGGFFTHQVRVAPSNTLVLTCAIGANPSTTAPEQLGQLTAFGFANGVLTQRQAIQPGPGLGPRHLDFHPSLPLAYVALERGNKLAVHRLDGDAISTAPIFSKDALKDPANPILPQQRVGAIHVHPQGGFVYLTNRSDAVQQLAGGSFFAGGENNVAVFAIDRASGEPTLIQHEDTRGFEPRTFTIDPSGRFLVVANQKALAARAGAAPTPPNLTLFRIGADGKLAFVGTTPMTQGGDAFWAGMVGLPG
jgi:6-phosphogluconolactonase (cycloisomerase 2 family)